MPYIAGVITAFYENDEQNVILAEIKIAEEDRNDENDHNCLMERRRLMTVPLLNLSKDVEPSIINESMTTSCRSTCGKTKGELEDSTNFSSCKPFH